MNNTDSILMAHGGGGTQSRELIRDIFARHFKNPMLDAMGDAAIVEIPRARLAFTTDAFVVKPMRFPGGDIGKLAICGTVNDLAASGARARYISASFIIEEGTPLALADEIASSMAASARDAGAMVVAGDTKVVERGKCDGIFISTSGIGELFTAHPMSPARIAQGDAILINGPIADHGMAIMAARAELSLETRIESDCAPLGTLAESLAAAVPEIRFMRDATRGGIAALLNEAAERQTFGIEIDATAIPMNEGTAAACEILGIDPLTVANEGKLVAFVPHEKASIALLAMQGHPLGRRAAIIGRATADDAGRVTIATEIGTRRILPMPSGEMLPRIC